ncbi:MAG: MiaB/RimO family radical SAM methylthiotransferase [Myxococcales bacterium]|nr:MiaB/RimO family radical SAM methylthiotransferase [Myxococcales bacterium]
MADTAEILSWLGNLAQLEESPECADVVLLNTCTVTHKADRDVRKILGSLAKHHPCLPVVVAGCGVKTAGAQLAKYPNVKFVVGSDRPESVAQALATTAGVDDGAARLMNGMESCGQLTLGRRRAFLKVQDGCNSSCTYCVVPLVRGRERSLPVTEIETRFSKLVEAGFLEVVLVGIHLGRYGLGEGLSLIWLLRQVDRWADRLQWNGRIRLSSIEPGEWNDELIDFLRSSKRICPHFHVPVQSGCADVLLRMGRPHSPDSTARLIERLAASFKDVAIGTDVLTGFPAESDSEARETERWLVALPFSYLHVFTYSKRPGTVAAELSGSVPATEIRARSARLREIGRHKWLDFLGKGIGWRHEVILEHSTSGGYTGRSESYRKIRVEQASPDGMARIVRVMGRAVRDGWLVCDGLQEA